MPVTLAPAVAPILTPGQCYVRALRLGFTFPQVDGGRVAIGPPQVTPAEKCELEAVRAYLHAHEAHVLAHADPAPGLRSASAAPRKVGTTLDGRPMDVPESERPEPPHIAKFKPSLRPAGSLLTIAECERELVEAEAGVRVAQWSLERLPEPAEDEPHDLQRRRESLQHQVNQLTEHYHAVSERRTELFLKHVDRSACERAKVVGPKLVVTGWHSGRTVPSA